MMPLSGLIEVAACTVMPLSIACLVTSHALDSHGSSPLARRSPWGRWRPGLRHWKMFVAIEKVSVCAGAPQQAYRRHMPGKWMSLSGLTIEVATRAVHISHRAGLSFRVAATSSSRVKGSVRDVLPRCL